MRFDVATLKFDDKGLIPAIAQDEGGAVLMMAWM
ncbi:MAG: phosphoribosyl-AMP cyclohydrolase, partial [Pseudomonadota bacterium]|nr:phosphoribosyl-AMP cyclohydrolase [Pseudomonadota bacterium]